MTRQIIISIPKINDNVSDFWRLFSLRERINALNTSAEVVFDFGNCNFLRPNAVAFIGGLIRFAQRNSHKVYVRNITDPIKQTLERNGFLGALGVGDRSFYAGNSVPYREDSVLHKDELVSYLRDQWLGDSRIRLSPALKDEIVGVTVEIYDNAFVHSGSPIGIMSCGQYFPTMNVLKLTAVDFGVGIPNNVRRYIDHTYTSSEALRWAFQRGHSTKAGDGIGRGMGLDVLKEFIKINDGTLEIYSENGYVKVGKKQEIYRDYSALFGGTLVNITIQCDKRYYLLQSELSEDSLQNPF